MIGACSGAPYCWTTSFSAASVANLETLYGAIDDGALAVHLPKHARKELDAYLDCGLFVPGLRPRPL